MEMMSAMVWVWGFIEKTVRYDLDV